MQAENSATRGALWYKAEGDEKYRHIKSAGGEK
jgi:hypothetical protein